MSDVTNQSAIRNPQSATDELSAKRHALVELLRSFQSCAVAFSGGVDSAVVAKAAHVALGQRAIAVTGVSPSLADGELELARELASLIGIRHVEVPTREFVSESYTRNAPDRCYHCKSELYLRMGDLLARFDVAVVANGANVDDAGDYRPGMQAAREQNVRSPLAECGFTKDDVRRLAQVWELPVWDKPASPCLSSRVAYGEEVTPQRLAMIDQAEQFLRSLGLRDVRVRYHRGDLARIEVSPTAIGQLVAPPVRERLIEKFRSLGFKFVTIDLQGFQSGSLNRLVRLG